jgi:DNA-binding NarL/FixJ family response regulator
MHTSTDHQRPTVEPRVLLVDDSPAMRRVLRGLLQDAGMTVIGEAGDGLEGVAQAEALQPDVVLMDWRMPNLDGIQATSRIRQRLPQVQVVMLTHAECHGAELARQAGAAAFLPKSAAVELICATVRTASDKPDRSAAER